MASLSGLPCSNVSNSAKSLIFSKISVYQRYNNSPRSAAVFDRHIGHATSAAMIALCMFAGSKSGTVPIIFDLNRFFCDHPFPIDITALLKQ
jgi:hypothetical protein